MARRALSRFCYEGGPGPRRRLTALHRRRPCQWVQGLSLAPACACMKSCMATCRPAWRRARSSGRSHQADTRSQATRRAHRWASISDFSSRPSAAAAAAGSSPTACTIPGSSALESNWQSGAARPGSAAVPELAAPRGRWSRRLRRSIHVPCVPTRLLCVCTATGGGRRVLRTRSGRIANCARAAECGNNRHSSAVLLLTAAGPPPPLFIGSTRSLVHRLGAVRCTRRSAGALQPARTRDQ